MMPGGGDGFESSQYSEKPLLWEWRENTESQTIPYHPTSRLYIIHFHFMDYTFQRITNSLKWPSWSQSVVKPQFYY